MIFGCLSSCIIKTTIFTIKEKYNQKIGGVGERTIQPPFIHLCISSDHSPLFVFTQQAHIISFLAFVFHHTFKLSISFSNVLFSSMISRVTGVFFFLFITFGSRKRDFFLLFPYWPSPIPSKFIALGQGLTQSYADTIYLCTHVSAWVCFSSIVWLLLTPLRSL